MYGGPGRDYLSGGNGADLMRGRRGSDGLPGGAGSDDIFGGVGDDWMTDWVETEFANPAPDDRDLLVGGAGDDAFGVSEGSDRVFGGRGDDRIGTDDDDAVDVIRCGPGRDVVGYFGPKDPLDVLIGCERVRVFE
jgi:Ca2+-binding RTX toxin-like protein